MSCSSASLQKPTHTVASPEKYYSFERDETGRIRALLTPTAKKAHVIYKIKHERTGKSYTGKTDQLLQKRVYSHQYGINHPERDVGKQMLYQDIRRSPQEFHIGIQCESSQDETLEDKEQRCIIANRSHLHGYNKNLGRGGGRALSQAASIIPSTPKLTEWGMQRLLPSAIASCTIYHGSSIF